MKAESFVYWLQGYFEIRGASHPTAEGLDTFQVEMIKRHLALVFKHEIDPSMGPPEHQQKLDAIHQGKLEAAIADLPPRPETTAPEPAWKVRPPDGQTYRC